jgi:cytochrome c biogenesis protein CcmG/thiol:disulfide interchange protein DsbE
MMEGTQLSHSEQGEGDGHMIRGWHVALILGLVGIVTLFYEGLWGNPRDIPTVLVGTQAPTFSGPEVNTGELISSDRFKGKVIMINFWASWCLECRQEHENLLAIHKQFGQDSNFVMLGINYQDHEEDAREYLQRFGSNFNHIQDLKGTISIDYGVYGVPETFILDQQGIIRYKQVGPIMGPVYTQLTEKVIAPLLRGSATGAL